VEWALLILIFYFGMGGLVVSQVNRGMWGTVHEGEDRDDEVFMTLTKEEGSHAALLMATFTFLLGLYFCLLFGMKYVKETFNVKTFTDR